MMCFCAFIKNNGMFVIKMNSRIPSFNPIVLEGDEQADSDA